MTDKRLHNVLLQAKKLKELILENPELPLVFQIEDPEGETDGDVCCTSLDARLGEVLSCEPPVGYALYGDREQFQYDVELWEDEGALEEDRPAAEIIKEYSPYWQPAILVWVGV